MAEPYVQLLFNYLTKQVTSTVFAPNGPAPHGPMIWQVTCDASGKVVIRDSKLAVIAIGQWTYNATKQRRRANDSKVDDARWDALDQALYPALYPPNGETRPIDPNALDPAELPGGISMQPPPPEPTSRAAAPEPQATAATPPTPEKKKSILRHVIETIGVIVILAVIGVLIYGYSKVEKDFGNGEECSFDNDCASHNCSRGVCRAIFNHNLSNGSHCDSSSECASNYCTSKGVCTTYRGGRFQD